MPTVKAYALGVLGRYKFQVFLYDDIKDLRMAGMENMLRIALKILSSLQTSLWTEVTKVLNQ
jgi:hypothetical protein